MDENKLKPVVRRLHKGRVCGCLVVLLGLLILIIIFFSRCGKKDDNNKDKSKASAVDAKVTQQSSEPEGGDGKYIICIDPGHGGETESGGDPGGCYGDRMEKTDNLTYAMEVYNELSKHDDIEVIMTRTTDTHLETEERSKIANDSNADLLIALHRNYGNDSTAKGVEVWVKKNPDVIDDVLGYKLMGKLKQVGIQNDRGVNPGYTSDEQENFRIIEQSNMTSCIIELGFITNDEDNRLFDLHYKEYAAAIADAVVEICNEYFVK